MMHDQPEALRALLEKCTETVIRYLKAQAQAGAHAVQLFDTWGGMLNEELYQQWALPYQQQIFEALRGMLPTILYVGHAAHLLKYFPQTGATVYSLDPTVTLKQARQVLGHQAVLQGNLDPTWLHCRPDTLTRLVQTMLAEGGDTGYIFNLGHGILPTTPQDHVKLVVELIKHASGAYHAGANTKVSA
jgi:uroporphyrinogen decarboxylase